MGCLFNAHLHVVKRLGHFLLPLPYMYDLVLKQRDLVWFLLHP